MFDADVLAGRLRVREGAAARREPASPTPPSGAGSPSRQRSRRATRHPANHIEIDKQRQILIVVRDGKVALVSPVSTAGIAGYYTPVGRFAIGRKIPGYDTSPLGVLYKPMYFYGGYAIHGNPSVPPYPASHGCVRVPNFVVDRLFESEPYGEAVIVYN